MKSLITGTAGFIGSHLAERLISGGSKVAGVDNLSTGRMENLEGIKNNSLFEFIRGDARDAGLMEDLISRCDCIFHLAASVGVKLFAEKTSGAIENNTESVINVLRLAKKYDRKVFLASSSEVYGKSNKPSLSEDDYLALGSPNILRWGYGCTKAMAEYLAVSYCREFGLKVVIARFFNVCGPRQTGSYGMVIPRFVTAALKNEPITVYGDGKQIRSFMYVDDAIDAVVSLAGSDETAGEVFNVGNPRYIDIFSLAQMIKKMTNSKSEIRFVPYEDVYGTAFEDMLSRVPDVKKIETAVRFSHKYQLEEMLGLIIEYWKNKDKKPIIQR